MGLALIAACSPQAPQGSPEPSGRALHALPLQATERPAPDSVEPASSGSHPPEHTLAVAARRLKRWSPVHATLDVKVIEGHVLSEDEAIVRTSDHHVGLTRDGGLTWHWHGHAPARVAAVAGVAGGPYAAVGASGYVALSYDGLLWEPVARYTGDDLVDAAIHAGLVVAVGSQGTYVWWSPVGRTGAAGMLPEGLRRVRLAGDAGDLLAIHGGKSFALSDDGRWTPRDPGSAPRGSAARWWTSRGLCRLGKAGPPHKLVCGVKGTAHGLGATTMFVLMKKQRLAVTRDGGASWKAAPAPFGGIDRIVGADKGPFLALGKDDASAVSSDGLTWRPQPPAARPAGLPGRPKPGQCERRWPRPGEVCTVSRSVTPPKSLPGILGADFVGDTGLIFGEHGLVGMSRDGGATWRARHGAGLGRIRDFAARGRLALVIDARTLLVSRDDGRTFEVASLPKRQGRLETLLLTRGGAAFVAGRDGTLCRSDGPLQSWISLRRPALKKHHFSGLFSLESAVYAATSGGMLFRSEDEGASWEPVPTGVTRPISSMVRRGATTLAVARGGADRPSTLIRSDDGGKHFYVAGELDLQGDVDNFGFRGALLVSRDMVSEDLGATWTPSPWPYAPGSERLATNSPFRLLARRTPEGIWQLVLAGDEPGAWFVLGRAPGADPWFRCDGQGGCWMGVGSRLFRPVETCHLNLRAPGPRASCPAASGGP